jgi:hypothetical protein
LIAFFSHVPEDLDRLSRLSIAERNAEASSLRGWTLFVSIHSSTTIAEQPLAATTLLPLTEFAVLERFDLEQAVLDLSTRGDDQTRHTFALGFAMSRPPALRLSRHCARGSVPARGARRVVKSSGQRQRL